MALVQKQADAADWLSQSLEVSFVDDSDVMRIRIRGLNVEMREERVVLDGVAQTMVGSASIQKRMRMAQRRDQAESSLLQARSELDEKIAKRDKLASAPGELDSAQNPRLAQIDAEVAKQKSIVDKMTHDLLALIVTPDPRRGSEYPARIVQHAMNVND